jgi:rare lipoprotein A
MVGTFAFTPVMLDQGTASAQTMRSPAMTGVASIYSSGPTASGQRLNPQALTAAHPRLPFGTKVRVTNEQNGRSVVVTINDRGPFVRGRIIDMTPAGARALGFSGTTRVTLAVITATAAVPHVSADAGAVIRPGILANSSISVAAGAGVEARTFGL